MGTEGTFGDAPKWVTGIQDLTLGSRHDTYYNERA